MEEKLDRLYKECVKELKNIGIDINNTNVIGNIDMKIARRNCKRYGCCKQEEPDVSTKSITKRGRSIIVKYDVFKKHHIEISKWVLELDDKIIKNTIMHELIHCMPYCSNHGAKFKMYAKYINEKLGYDISTVGNKRLDYEKSNLKYDETKYTNYKYKVVCKKCGQEFYRQRIKSNFTRKYKCGKCGGKFQIFEL